MAKPLTLSQTRTMASAYQATYFKDTFPVEDPEGRSQQHMAWMLNRIVNDARDDMPIDKASRWIGFVQAWLLLFNQVTLDNLKQNVRDAREA